MHFEIETFIEAPAQVLWDILVNKNKLLAGGFGVPKLEGEIAMGGSIKVWSEASPSRAFPLKITTFDAPRCMVWEGGMPLGLFKGVRRFEITPQGRKSRFLMREDYTGLLKGLIGKSIPDLNPSFEKFATALKRVAEGA